MENTADEGETQKETDGIQRLMLESLMTSAVCSPQRPANGGDADARFHSNGTFICSVQLKNSQKGFGPNWSRSSPGRNAEPRDGQENCWSLWQFRGPGE